MSAILTAAAGRKLTSIVVPRSFATVWHLQPAWPVVCRAGQGQDRIGVATGGPDRSLARYWRAYSRCRTALMAGFSFILR